MSANEPLKIVNTDRLGGDQLIVTFSDKRTMLYTVDQLTNITPKQIESDRANSEEEPIV